MAEARVSNYVRGRTSGVRWLHEPGGRGLLGSLAGLMDSVLGDASAGAKEAMIRECSDVALDPHARNTGDRRTLVDTNTTLRSYLWQRWDAHKEAGTEDGLHRQMARLGYSTCEFWSWQRLKLAGVPGNVAFGGRLGFFFVVIRQPHPFVDGPSWDGGDDWDGGALWGTGTRYDGIDAAEAIAEIAFTLQRWRPSGRSPRFVVIDLDGSTQVVTAAPYNFTGNYLLYPIWEPHEYRNGAPVDVYNTRFA